MLHKMEPNIKIEALFSHADKTAAESTSENSKPAVYTPLFSGEAGSGQIA